jgi:phosphate uptake regulator
METRKVQTVGGGTFTVSLPKQWIESTGIDAGSTVNLHNHIDDLLVIQPQELDTDVITSVRVLLPDDEPTFVERTIRAAYAAGLREVVLTTKDGLDDIQRRAVERVTRTLTGMTIAEETERHVTVRAMLDAGEVSIRQSVRQLEFVALSLHREATAALTADAGIHNPADRDDQADRLYSLVDRYFGRGLSRLDEIDALDLTRSELFTLWLTARELERIGDHAERIAATAAEADPAPSTGAELNRVAEMARETVSDAVTAALGDDDATAAREALDRRTRVRKDAADLERRLFEAANADYRLVRVLDSLSRTAEHGGNIAEIGLQRAIRDGDFAMTEAAAGDVGE